jgi:hypothetical protein
MLIPDERALLRKYCHEHPVATCPQCSEALTFDRLGNDLIIGRRDFCPACRVDLTTALRLHLVTCTVIRVQAREVRERAGQVEQGGREPAVRSPEPTATNGSNHAHPARADAESTRVIPMGGLTD